MTTRAQVAAETLRTLHRIHQQLGDLRDRLARGPRLIQAHQANLAKMESQITEIKAEAKKQRVAMDGKQLQLSTNEAAVQKRRGQLREAKDNREYQALKEEIAASAMTNSVLEDEIIEAMERIEGMNAKVAEAEASLATAKKQSEKVFQEIAQQRPGLEADLHRLEGELPALEEELPVDIRETYRRAVKGKGADAMAMATGGVCGGCNQHVPLNLVAELLLSRPMLCKSCGRLLYLPESGAGDLHPISD
jgi:predicted  nucleic acid-binding Zn-ribbon protein